MSPLDRDARRTSIAVLVAISLVTGFFVATTATGEEYTTVGTAAEDNQAYKVALEENQRIQLALEEGEMDRTPQSSFAVYDPDDEFFASFDLAGSDTLELIADQEGDWVLFVTETTNAELEIQFTEEHAEEDLEIESLAVEETQHVIAEQEEGALSEELALRIDPRPATAELKAEGTYEALDAELATDEGAVHVIEDASANETEDGFEKEATTVFNPRNLLAGTYHVDASADEFQGELVLAHYSYDRNVTEEVEEVEDPLEDVTVVTSAQEHEAHEVDAATADQLVFAVDHDTRAQVLVYGDNNTVTHIEELEGDRVYDEDNETHKAEAMDVRALEVDAEQPVVFVQYLSGQGDAVMVGLTGVEEQDRSTLLDIETETVTFEHSQSEAQEENVTLTGGLVGIATHASQDSMSMERTLDITGPEGEIAHIEESAALFGGSFTWEYGEVNQENFSDGEIELVFEERSFVSQGETTIELAHFVPAE